MASICLESNQGKATPADIFQTCKDLDLGSDGRQTLQDVFLRTGFLVEDSEDDWCLGIPSLGSYIIKKAQGMDLHPLPSKK